MVDQLTLQTMGILLTGLTVSIAAIYYMLTLRYTRMNMKNTLETRQAQMFLGIYNKITDKEFTQAYNTVMNTSWSSYQEFSDLRKTPEFYEPFLYINGFFEGIGVLVKQEVLDIRWIALLMASWTIAYWEKIREAIMEHKKITGARRLLSEYEYLYNELMKYIEEHPELKT